MAVAVALMVVVTGVSGALGLNLEPDIVRATWRTMLQLLFLGSILQPVIDANSPWLVALICGVMLTIASSEAYSRVQNVYSGAWLHCCFSLLLGVSWNIAICVCIVVQPDPLWRPDYVIPLWGMVLGNTVTGVAVGLNSLTEEISGTAGENLEILLCSGANRLEAVTPVLAQAVTKGLSPQLNTMSVLGIVAIPGMMTGQILGGVDPLDAAYYQMMIMFFLSSAAVTAVVSSTLLAVSTVIDDGGRLRRDRLRKNAMGKDWIMKSLRSCCCREDGSVSPASPRSRASPLPSKAGDYGTAR
eukprot:TRINITY_DN1728_c0_g1_i1.p1 TRINITY_DN1728_c0_g1~~TRINITY_DN1728_c0_g1_i1.p1  ORF type:complete len:345 (+),score=71.28 TRINITY_DN1728_c0_g1_i1:137-1036(+)